MGARRGGSQFLLTSQCASRNTTTTPFASFAPLVRDLVNFKMVRKAWKDRNKEPDEAFALSISHKTDKSSEDPDVVLQTLGSRSSKSWNQILNYFHLSEVFLV